MAESMTNYNTAARKPADELDDEIKYKLLSNGRRRAVVEELHDHAPLTKSELADKLTERSDEHPSGKERKRIYISIHQQHIPKLMEEGVILKGDDGYVLGPTSQDLLDEMGYPPEDSGESDEVEGDEEDGSGFRGRLSGMLKGSS